MSQRLPPLPLKIPLADKDGMMHQAWVAWFRDLLQRIGGTEADTNTELKTLITALDVRVTALE